MGFLLWVICGFMVVKVGGCCGDGGGMAMGFGLGMFFVVVVVAEVIGVFVFIWVLGYIILLHRNIILMCCIVK